MNPSSRQEARPSVTIRPIDKEGRAFTVDMLTDAVFPYIPPAASKEELLQGINLCETPFRDLLTCVRRTQAEGLCQNEFVSYLMCKSNRDAAIVERVAAWQGARLGAMSKEERTVELHDAESSMNAIVQSAADFCGSAELQQENRKYCAQVISDLKAVRGWMNKLAAGLP